MSNLHCAKEPWKKSLKKCPDWVLAAVDLHGKKYDYIAHRLAQGADHFLLNAKDELERALQGTKDGNSEYRLNSFEQRVAFFIMALKFADYFRPISNDVWQQIPNTLKPKSHPSALDDLDIQKVSRIKIGRLARNIADLLRQHNLVTQRLGVHHIECDPLDLIERSCAKSHNDYLSGMEYEFQRLQALKKDSIDQTLLLAGFMDELSKVAETQDGSLNPAEVQLGVTSRKSDHHFFNAFSNWLTEHAEEYGGFIPNNFHLSDRCWATLITCLTYRDVDEKSVQMARKRAAIHQQKAYDKIPRFDIDELIESWGKQRT